MKNIYLFSIVLFLTINLFGQNYKQVRIYLQNSQTIQQLHELGLKFDHFSKDKNNSINTFVSDKEFNLLASSPFQYDVIIDNWFNYYNSRPVLTPQERSDQINQSKEEYNVESFGFGSMGGYYTYQEIVNNLDSMYANFPNIITQKFSIGTSHEGRTIWAVKISDNPNTSESEPQVGFDALVHAREPQSMATLMYFMYYLLENYGTDPEVTYLVDNREIYCVPCFNPDGYEYNRQTNPGGGGMWRKNRRNNGGSYGVDLNRNFSYMWGYDNLGSSPYPSDDDYRGPSAFSEPEAQAIRDFVIPKNIHTYFNMHSYQDAILYPWGYIDEETTDSLTYREFATDMAHYNSYVTGYSGQILGYNSNGSVRDWMYGEQSAKNKVYGYTIEIGNSNDGFWPPQYRIFPIAQINVKTNLYQCWVAGGYVKPIGYEFNTMYFNPGDNVELTPVLKNKGLVDLSNISAGLVSLSPYATIGINNISVGTIAARTIDTASTPFSFTIDGSVPIGEHIALELTTYTSGTAMSMDTITLTIGTPMVLFNDNNDDPAILWNITSTPTNPHWEATTTTFYSSPTSYTDSRIGNYSSNATVTMVLKDALDLAGAVSPVLNFKTKFSIEDNWDYGQVSVSTNNGVTWTPLTGNFTNAGTGSFQPAGQPLYDGTQSTWVPEEIDLTAYENQQVKIRFQLKSDGYVQEDGWYVDDISIYYFGAVPVELSSFELKAFDNKIQLNWQTASELNNRGFEIQRSRDNQNWEKLGFVNGAGTISEICNYSFDDLNPLNGKSHYRLIQVDFDGTTKILGTRDLDFTGHFSYSLAQNYPNPFNPETNIRYSIAEPGLVTIKLFNILGQEIYTFINRHQDAGEYVLNFSINSVNFNLPSGIYFYTIKSGSFSQTKKMVIMK